MRPTRTQFAGIVTITVTVLLALQRWRRSEDDTSHDIAPSGD
ncbi:hypothetical protein [Halorientalis regularis]|nr:hypothetical protein [Halorientalis regularis]